MPGVAAASSSLVVHRQDGTTQLVTAAEIDRRSDVFDTQYFTRSVPQAEPQQDPYVDRGLSVAALLRGLDPPQDPATVGFVELPRPDGTRTTLTKPDLAEPSDFDGSLPAVLRVDGEILEYVRPLYDDPADVNASDKLRSMAGGHLDLYIHSGPLLRVSATASDMTVGRGDAVTFLATATGSSHPLTYSWDFGDGSAGDGASVTHSFKAVGTYQAIATVHGDDDSGGASNLITIIVGDPQTPAAPGTGGVGTDTTADAPATGPASSTGGSRVGAVQATEPSRSAAKSVPGAKSPDKSPGPAVKPAKTPQPEPAAQTAIPVTSPATTVAGRPAGGRAPRAPKSRRPTPGTRGTVPLIRGQVIDAELARAITTRSAGAATPATAPAAGAPKGVDRLGSAAAIAALLSLLAWGMTRERRSSRGRIRQPASSS